MMLLVPLQKALSNHHDIALWQIVSIVNYGIKTPYRSKCVAYFYIFLENHYEKAKTSIYKSNL